MVDNDQGRGIMGNVNPLIDSDKPLTHMVGSFCEVRVPECEVDYFEEHPEDLGRLVLAQFNRCAVTVIGIVYEDYEDCNDDE